MTTKKIHLRHGAIENDISIPPFNHEAFIRQNAGNIVVAEKDELEDILKYPDGDNIENDAVLLLNSRRLDFSDPKAVADIIRNRFGERFSESPFAGLSDNEIFANIKSRHIQSFSELDRYSEYLAASLPLPQSVDKQIEEKSDTFAEVVSE